MPNKLLLVLGVISLSSIILLASPYISALGDDSISKYDPDKRTRAKMGEPTHSFQFKAYNVCNEKYEQCFDIWGQGVFNFGEVSAYGNYVKYKEDPSKTLESSWWRDTDFMDASDTHIIFKAEPAVKGHLLTGFIVIEIFEGKTSDTGSVCVYGNLFDKQNPSKKEDADCTNNAYVKIENVS